MQKTYPDEGMTSSNNRPLEVAEHLIFEVDVVSAPAFVVEAHDAKNAQVLRALNGIIVSHGEMDGEERGSANTAATSRIEAKVDICNIQLAELIERTHPARVARRIELSAKGAQFMVPTHEVAAAGLLTIFLSRMYPLPVKLGFKTIEQSAEPHAEGYTSVTVEFQDMGRDTEEALSRHVFLLHRKAVAARKLAEKTQAVQAD